MFSMFFRKNAKTQKMNKWLSYRKIRCFVRVAMFKKASAALKKCIVFFIDVSSIFRQKTMKNCEKNMQNVLLHKNRQKTAFGTPILAKSRFLPDFWDPSGYPRRARDVPGPSQNPSFFFLNQLRLKTGSDSPREAPGVHPGISGVPFWVNLLVDFAWPKTSTNFQKC